MPDDEDKYRWWFSFDSETQEIVEAEKEHVESGEKSELQNLELLEIATRVHEAWDQLSQN